MESLINFVREYRKTLATSVVGAVLYFGRSYLPDLFSPELNESITVAVTGIIIFLIGRFTRIKTTEAHMLNSMEKNQV